MAVRQIGHRKSSLVLSGRFPSPNDVPVLLLNQPNIALGGVRFWIASDPQVIKHQHLTFSVAVCSSLAHILRQVQWWSVAIVTRYDVISSRWSSHFWVKMHAFSTFYNNKCRTRGWNDTKCLFVCYFTRQAQKITILTWFLILGKIQDGGQDGNLCWWRHRPPAAPPHIKYTSSFWWYQRQNSFSGEGFHHPSLEASYEIRQYPEKPFERCLLTLCYLMQTEDDYDEALMNSKE